MPCCLESTVSTRYELRFYSVSRLGRMYIWYTVPRTLDVVDLWRTVDVGWLNRLLVCSGKWSLSRRGEMTVVPWTADSHRQGNT